MKKSFALVGALFLVCACVFVKAQDNSPVLMTIGDKDVSLPEFMNVYNKNSNGLYDRVQKDRCQ